MDLLAPQGTQKKIVMIHSQKRGQRKVNQKVRSNICPPLRRIKKPKGEITADKESHHHFLEKKKKTFGCKTLLGSHQAVSLPSKNIIGTRDEIKSRLLLKFSQSNQEQQLG